MRDDMPANESESLSPFLTTAPAVDALNRLERGLGVRRPFLVITGQSGMGKTTLAREAIRRWGERVCTATLTTTVIDSASLPAAMISAFGGSIPMGTPAFTLPERLMETLANATSGGRIAVLVVDGADALAVDELMELQRLAAKAEQRQCPIELLLVGAPALAQRFDAEPLRADVSVKVSLEPLSPHDTRHYLLQRPAGNGGAAMFSRKACRDIHTASRGRIRDIEAIATESAKRAARANATTVSPEHVRAAAQAVRSRKPTDKEPVKPGAAPQRAAQAEAPETAEAAPAPQKAAPAKPTAPAAKAAATPAKPAATNAKPTAAPSKPASTPAKQAAANAKPAAASAKPAAAPAPPPPAEAVASAKPPEPPEPAESEPVAQGSHVDEEASASAAANVAGEATDSGEFRPSDDPRVKDWIKRFGGAGVRIGANYAPSSGGSLGFSDDTAGDVRPLGKASAADSNDDAQVVEPTMREAEEAPSIDDSARRKRPARSAQSDRRERAARSEQPAQDEAPAVSRAARHEAAATSEPVVWPPPSAPSNGGYSRSRRGDSPLVWQASTVVLALTLGLVLWGQRGNTVRSPNASTADVAPADSIEAESQSRTKAPRPKRGPKSNTSTTRPARNESAPPQVVRFSVAVGTFLDAEMARAERDHLARLVRFRVWVNSSNVGGVRSHRIQFGAFESRAEAEEAAQKLMRQGLIRDASVVELPPAD